jgi:hypothetical protein
LVVLGVLGELGVLGVEPRLPEPLLLPEPMLPVLPDPLLLPEPMLPVLPEPLLPEPRLPDPEVLPEPLVLPYCFTQSSRSVPVLPMHWLGVAALSLLVLPLVLEPEEPVAPEPDEPDPTEPEPLAPEPALPPTLGLDVELPLLLLPLPVLPEVCAQDTVARPSRAAATAALSCFAITMVLSFGWGRLQAPPCKRDAATERSR